MTLLEIILLIIGAGCLIAGFFIPERPKTKASWEEKKEIKRMHDLIDSDLEKYKENLKKSLEDEMNEYMENAHKGIESLSDEKIKAVKECGETAIGDINKNHDEVKESLKTIESYKDEATADFEKSKSALDEAKDALKAIENAKDEAKADIESAKDEARADTENSKNEADDEIEQSENSLKSDVNDENDLNISVGEIEIEEVVSETYSYESEGEFTGVLSDDPEDDLIKILKEGMDESETGISDTSKENSETSEETKKTKKNKRGTKKTVKRSAESISFASKNTDEILRLYKEGKSNVAIAKELGIGVGEVKLVIDLANM